MPLTPYYQDAAVTLYHGDCREIIPTLEPVNIVVMDPPYNAGKNYGDGTNDRREWPEWCNWFDGVLAQCFAKSRDGVLSFLSQTRLSTVRAARAARNGVVGLLGQTVIDGNLRCAVHAALGADRLLGQPAAAPW